MKQKQTITHRFLKYLILIIIGSNLLVAMFLYGIMRDNAMKQAENLRQNLMESNLSILMMLIILLMQLFIIGISFV